MATVTRTAPRPAARSAGAPAPGAGVGHRLSRWIREHLVVLAAAVVLIYTFLPIAVVVLLSFNHPASRLSYSFDQFTFDNWLHPCGAADMCKALGTSLKIGVASTVASTVLGTLMAFALGRHRFRGRAATNLLIFLPMATPEVVMGSSLLAIFVSLRVSLGQGTILIAHIMFCLSFVVVTVKARIAGMDPRLEQAAMDLYANEWQTFRRVTLPLVFPGIAAAALLAFSLSFDDFIVTNFNSGRTVTFPMFVWGSAQRGIPPQVYVVGSLMFVVSLLFVVGAQLVRRKPGRAQ